MIRVCSFISWCKSHLAGGIGEGCKFPEDSLYVILVGKQPHYNLNPPKYLPLARAIRFAEREGSKILKNQERPNRSVVSGRFDGSVL